MKVSQLRQIIKEEISRALNEEKSVLEDYAEKLYEFFKKVPGATPTYTKGEGSIFPNVGGFNIIIEVTRGGDLKVGVKHNKDKIEKYLGLVSEEFPALEPEDDIKFYPVPGGGSYGVQTFMLTTTEKDGSVGNTQTNR